MTLSSYSVRDDEMEPTITELSFLVCFFYIYIYLNEEKKKEHDTNASRC